MLQGPFFVGKEGQTVYVKCFFGGVVNRELVLNRGYVARLARHAFGG